jgi:serine protease Do
MLIRFLLSLILAIFYLLPLASTPAQAAVPASFADIVEPRLAAVVNISTTQKMRAGQGLAPFDLDRIPDDPTLGQFKDLFRKFGEQFKRSFKNKNRRSTSLGSGFVIDAKGYIVTNNHVIADAEEITITFHDDVTLPATIVGRDTKTDLALLKVEAKSDLTFVSFGDSDNLRVGEWVIAVGNPFGLGGSVSAGIVSARGRNINVGPFDDFIQTDAAINRGNSGGPLFNVAGEVVGINSAIFSPTGGSVGIGFAVPSALAEPIIKQLRAKGHAERAWLGVQIQEVTEEIAASIGLGKPYGALILEVDPDGPAHDSGIRPGDIVTRFDGNIVQRMRNLPRMVAESKINKTVKVQIWRDGGHKNYRVKLGELPGDDVAKETQKTREKAKHDHLILGAELRGLNRQLREEYRVTRDVKGVLITGLDRSGALARVGARNGDVILQINQRAIEQVSALKAEIQKARKKHRKTILLRVQRGQNTQFVTVPIEK